MGFKIHDKPVKGATQVPRKFNPLIAVAAVVILLMLSLFFLVATLIGIVMAATALLWTPFSYFQTFWISEDKNEERK